MDTDLIAEDGNVQLRPDIKASVEGCTWTEGTQHDDMLPEHCTPGGGFMRDLDIPLRH